MTANITDKQKVKLSSERDVLNPEIPIGSVCRLSAIGKANHPLTQWSTGVVVGRSATGNTIRLKMQGRKTVVSLHASYIELVEPKLPRPALADLTRHGLSQHSPSCEK
jgi:hypothetical protein